MAGKRLPASHEQPCRISGFPWEMAVMRHYFRLILCLVVILYSAAAIAVGERGALVRAATLYLSPDTNSSKLTEVGRGHEIVILETSRGWAHVEALLGGQSQRRDDEDEERQGKTITGWLLDKG